ncbi:MAG: ferredoxin [Candidatus Woesearchaeota archaeon]|jgi:ferredoxin|nr:ferredoxin [Candidatus Woesearchaeota archaeon]
MAKFKIEVNEETCIGCGACTAQCDNFEMDENNKAKAKMAEVEDVGCNKDAEGVCPVSCIKITEI